MPSELDTPESNSAALLYCNELFSGDFSPVYIVNRISPRLFGIGERLAIAVSAVLLSHVTTASTGNL
jgi:hypothetical protein